MNGIVLIRHAETDWAGKFCGHSDPDLNSAGERRLRSLVEEIAPLGIQRIYSSDLRRASRTAAALGERIRVSVELRPGLREIHFGLWEGLSWAEVEQQYPHEAALWAREFPAGSVPGGESYGDFIARVEAEFSLLLREKDSMLPTVVTHRGVLEYALRRFFGFSEADARSQTEEFGAVILATQMENLPGRRVDHQN
jgi:alpha-ribazole phosphatase/probable phosphoglycerate mutase